MTWIDFRGLRESLNFVAVLKHYGVELKQKGKDQHQAFCPLPNHQGQHKSPSFSVHLGRRIFQCFGCGKRGNILDFCVLMEGKSVANMRDVQEVAHMLKERFLGSAAAPDKTREGRGKAPPTTPPTAASSPQHVIVNAPLDFELKNLDPKHPYLFDRGFTGETIAHFGLGFCSRGRTAGRIAIPLHDQQGHLIGYAGRLTKDKDISAQNPKYLFPCDREREGVTHEFRKGLFLYNGHAITEPVSDLVVVEGFPSVWWLWQHGVQHVVALMGSSCSPEQGKLIVNLVAPSYANAPGSGGRVWVLTDGDEAGERCAHSVFSEVAATRCVRWVRLDAGKQPTDYPPEHVLSELLTV